MPAKTPRPLRVGPKKTAEEAVHDAELRSGKATRVVSMSQFYDLTGHDRGTLNRWIKRGCPIEGKGPKGAVLVDVRSVIEWLQEQARIDERRKAPEAAVDDSLDPEIELKREQLKFQKIRTAQLTGVMVMSGIVETTFASCLNVIRQSVMGLPSRIERDLIGFSPAVVRKAKTDMTIQCRSALKEAQNEIENTIRRITKQRLVEMDAEEEDPFDGEDEDDLGLKEEDDE